MVMTTQVLYHTEVENAEELQVAFAQLIVMI